jgi:hypothetical protein
MTNTENELEKYKLKFTKKAFLISMLGVGAVNAALFSGIFYFNSMVEPKANTPQPVTQTHHLDHYVQGNHSYYVFDDKIASEVCVKTSKSPLGLIEEGVRVPLNRIGYDNKMLTKLVSQLNYDTSCEHIQPGQVYLGLRPASQNLGSITNNPKLETRAIPKTHNYN